MATAIINDFNLYYELLGEKDAKETVVFLNGILSSVNSWYAQSDILVKMGFRVLLHDFRGQLKSDKPDASYSFKDNVEDTKKLLDILNIEEAYFAGISHGGIIAQRFALEYPDLVKGLVLINTLKGPDAVMKLLDESSTILLENMSENNLISYMLHLIAASYNSDFLKKNLNAIHERVNNAAKLGKDFFLAQKRYCEAYVNDSFDTERLASIKCPVLIIASETDRIAPVRHSEQMFSKMPHAEFVLVKEAGHAIIVEKPNIISILILGFVQKLSLEN